MILAGKFENSQRTKVTVCGYSRVGDPETGLKAWMTVGEC